jgi:hypothetical protein
VPKTPGKDTTKDANPLVGHQRAPCDLQKNLWQRNKRETDNSTHQPIELTWDKELLLNNFYGLNIGS